MNAIEKKLYESFMLTIAANYIESPTLSARTILRVIENMRHDLTEDWIKNNPKRIAELRDVYK